MNTHFYLETNYDSYLDESEWPEQCTVHDCVRPCQHCYANEIDRQYDTMQTNKPVI